jgi:hypothetical protein
VDGQEAILVDSLTAPKYAWRFRYSAGITDAYKWVFIGGAPYSDKVFTQEGSSASDWVDLATLGPSLTIPRAGNYLVRIGFHGGTYANDMICYMAYAVGAITAAAGPASPAVGGGTGYGGMQFTPTTSQVVPILAGDVLLAKYWSNNGWFASRWMDAVPVRVS